jgi:hypothetical protein
MNLSVVIPSQVTGRIVSSIIHVSLLMVASIRNWNFQLCDQVNMTGPLVPDFVTEGNNLIYIIIKRSMEEDWGCQDNPQRKN